MWSPCYRIISCGGPIVGWGDHTLSADWPRDGLNYGAFTGPNYNNQHAPSLKGFPMGCTNIAETGMVCNLTTPPNDKLTPFPSQTYDSLLLKWKCQGRSLLALPPTKLGQALYGALVNSTPCYCPSGVMDKGNMTFICHHAAQDRTSIYRYNSTHIYLRKLGIIRKLKGQPPLGVFFLATAIIREIYCDKHHVALIET